MGKKLQINYTKPELDKIKEIIYFSDLEIRIIDYRAKSIEREIMADMENLSVSTIDRRIKDISIKIKNAIDKNLL